MSGRPEAPRPPVNNLGPVVREVVAGACRVDDLVRQHGVKPGPGELRHQLADLEEEVVLAISAWRGERGLPHWRETRKALVQIAVVALRALRDVDQPR